MKETDKNHEKEFEQIEKILLLQKYPCEIREYIERIVGESDKKDLAWIFIKGYCLGVINGKREERKKRKCV